MHLIHVMDILIEAKEKENQNEGLVGITVCVYTRVCAWVLGLGLHISLVEQR